MKYQLKMMQKKPVYLSIFLPVKWGELKKSVSSALTPY